MQNICAISCYMTNLWNRNALAYLKLFYGKFVEGYRAL